MDKILTHKYANYMVTAAMLLVVYIAYVFSFSHAFEAVKLNRELSGEKDAGQSLSVSYPQLELQHKFYLNALKAYRVPKEDRENRLWQAVSGIALSKDNKISFVPNIQDIGDTVAVKKGIYRQQFMVKGQYFSIVRFLDSVARTEGIGRISELKLATAKKEGIEPALAQLQLQFTMVAQAK